jgi:hypothetical protein
LKVILSFLRNERTGDDMRGYSLALSPLVYRNAL